MTKSTLRGKCNTVTIPGTSPTQLDSTVSVSVTARASVFLLRAGFVNRPAGALKLTAFLQLDPWRDSSEKFGAFQEFRWRASASPSRRSGAAALFPRSRALRASARLRFPFRGARRNGHRRARAKARSGTERH